MNYIYNIGVEYRLNDGNEMIARSNGQGIKIIMLIQTLPWPIHSGFFNAIPQPFGCGHTKLHTKVIGQRFAMGCSLAQGKTDFRIPCDAAKHLLGRCLCL
jgi:hypothetical protein